jgi:cyclase
MSKTRIIARIDVKNQHVIKGIQFDGLRKLGNPNDFARNYYLNNIDEIIFMDAVASLYDRNNLYNIIKKACEEVFVPITVGGGIRKIDDIKMALESGADKVAINTQAIKSPSFIHESSRIFGKQCIVGSIEAKKNGNTWEAYIDNGREKTGIDVIEWVQKLQDLGVGELMITSVDKEGTQSGLDLELLKKIQNVVRVPLIVSGGIGNLDHIGEACKNISFGGLAIASILHYNKHNIGEIKQIMKKNGLRVR